MKISAFLISLTLLFLSCHETLQQSPVQIASSKSTLVSGINFYPFDSNFLIYFPDTAISQFKTLKDLNNYSSQKIERFLIFCKNEIQKNNNESTKLSIRSAQIEFYHWMNILYVNQLWNLPRNAFSMADLLFYASLTDENNFKKTITLFHSFPETIKKSPIGRKTWVTIQESLPDRNAGFEMNKFDNLKLVDKNGKNCLFSQSMNDSYNFHILVFGASWCLPCRIDEKQLEMWMGQIDTSNIEILGFSIDRNEDKWRKYLQEEPFPWRSFLLEGGWDNEILNTLHFKSVPMNFLIDRSGKIIMQHSDIRRILCHLSTLN